MDSKLNMSRIEVPRCGTALKALSALFRSDRFDEHDIANASAMLAQKGMPVQQQTLETKLKFMLNCDLECIKLMSQRTVYGIYTLILTPD